MMFALMLTGLTAALGSTLLMLKLKTLEWLTFPLMALQE